MRCYKKTGITLFDVFAHKVCDVSVRDKDSRWIFLICELAHKGK